MYFAIGGGSVWVTEAGMLVWTFFLNEELRLSSLVEVLNAPHDSPPPVRQS